MRNRKLLYVLIPLIIIVLVLITGVVYLKLNSSPEKIFANSVSKAFEMLETSQEQYTTMKGTMNLTASVESDNEEMQAINTMLEGTSIGLNMEMDTTNMIVNEKLNVTVNNESLLNAAILLQDQKGYVYLKDYLDKYLELPEENMEYSDLTEYYDKIATLDQKSLMDAIKEELIVAISNQKLVQENLTLILDGQETKVTASILDLQGQEKINFAKGFFAKLKENPKFQTALGDFKDDVMIMIDDMLTDEGSTSEDVHLVFSIYTKGFLNEFVGVSAKVISDSYYQGYSEIEILKHNDSKYEFISYEGERAEAKITVEDIKENKNNGTATISITVDEEQFVLIYDYEKQGEQLYFSLSTEIEGIALSFSGNVVENGSNFKGTFVVSIQEETMGKVNLNCAYDFNYGVEIQRVDTENSVLIDELSEEDQTTLITNLQNSPLYQLIEQSGLLDSGIENFDAPEVTDYGFTVKYNVPENFQISEYSSEDYKTYIDENYNTISVTVRPDMADMYLNDLENEYVITSEFYKNQNLSDIKTLNVNGKEYKFRTLTYNDEYGSYLNLYFTYELDDEHCYVVEVETESGSVSMDTIKNFLNVTLNKSSIQSAIDSERNLGSRNVYINGEETVNVNDIINVYTSAN